ncbi:hypothetical protein [Actibacterium sp. XHP0104]|uniref:hypothetical protein n=1 Tax=Actibacterium sp. XHP0104 TaxID=2984335 RepID=UPI0021E824D3|nr:hypothetical protein [Actibacterium sp. XHP0104]MCV2881701.1 hypothetical protein [Actibacterium sp. XHP0104]
MELMQAVERVREERARKGHNPVPDLTLAKNPAEVWEEPEDAPDYPDAKNPMSLTKARDRLARLRNQLSGLGPYRDPTPEEAAKIFNDTSTGTWKQRQLIEKALTLHGYIRKLEAREQRIQRHVVDRTKELAQRKVGEFNASMVALEAELPDLIAGAERHRQRLANEGAFNRLRMLKPDITAQLNSAAHAAREAGIEPPSLPDWLARIPGDL